MTDIEGAILHCFAPGCGAYASDIIDELHLYGKTRVRNTMTDMRRRGFLYYIGNGIWHRGAIHDPPPHPRPWPSLDRSPGTTLGGDARL